MNYADGTPARLGDLVRLGQRPGVVVVSLDADAFAPGFARADWAYLERGIMVEVEGIGLIHYTCPEADLVFVARAADMGAL